MTWRKLRRAIATSLSGHQIDCTTGPVSEGIVLLAVPMVIEMIMESLFAIVDVFWVARLGKDAVAAVGLTESMLSLVYTLAMGLSIGVTAMVARRIGEHDSDSAARATVQGIVLGIGLAIVVGLLGATQAPVLLRFMGAEPSLVESGAPFTRIMLGGSGSVLLLFIINAAFRGAGDAAIAMRTLILANSLNMLLDPCFIFGLGPFPQLGVTGAAVATTTGRTIGVIYQVWSLWKSGARLRLQPRMLRIDLGVLRRLVSLSGVGIAQSLISTAAWIALTRIVSSFGAAAVAGYTIAIRVVMFGLLPSWGIANATATMVGQSLGALDPERARQAVWRAGFINLCVMGVVGTLFVIWARPIVTGFTDDVSVLDFATMGLRVIASGFLFYAYGMVFLQAFNGAGDAWTPMLINIACFWVGELPLAWFLARHTSLGTTGVFMAVAVAFSAEAVLGGLLFQRGRWATRKV